MRRLIRVRGMMFVMVSAPRAVLDEENADSADLGLADATGMGTRVHAKRFRAT